MSMFKQLVFAIAASSALLIATMLTAANKNHTAEPLYPCTPMCGPDLREVERAFGKSDLELVRDMIKYDRERTKHY
jgi:hypothetical protein